MISFLYACAIMAVGVVLFCALLLGFAYITIFLTKDVP